MIWSQRRLAEYRADLEGYKAAKRTWPDVRQHGPLANPAAVAHYQALLAATDRLMTKLSQVEDPIQQPA